MWPSYGAYEAVVSTVVAKMLAAGELGREPERFRGMSIRYRYFRGPKGGQVASPKAKAKVAS